MDNIAWNVVCEKCRDMWRIYHSMTDVDEKKRFDKAMSAMMEIIIRLHGFVPEKTA